MEKIMGTEGREKEKKVFQVRLERAVMEKISDEVNLSALFRAFLAAGFLPSNSWNVYLETHPRERREWNLVVGRLAKLIKK